MCTLHAVFYYSVIVSNVYSVGVSRSWRGRTLDVKLSVCGSLHQLQAVRIYPTDEASVAAFLHTHC